MMFADQFKLFRRPGFWNFPDNPFTYPAPLALVFAAIYKLGHAWRDYTLACGVFALAWACWLATGLHRRGVSLASACVFAGVALATSWPIYFQLDSANIEAVVSVVLALGVLASWRGRWWWAAVLIGLAGALKIFPLVLLGLVLSQRKYKEFATGVATAFVVTVGSLAYVGPTIVEAQHSVASGLLSLRRYNLVPGTPMVANHSLWMLIKWAWVKVDWHLRPIDLAREYHTFAAMLNIYVVTSAILGTALYVLWIRRLPLLNQILCLTICAVLLPPTSMDYTLLHLLVPFGLLCMELATVSGESSNTKGMTLCLLCFAVIFSADTFLDLYGDASSQIRTIALLGLLATVLRYRFQTSAETVTV